MLCRLYDEKLAAFAGSSILITGTGSIWKWSGICCTLVTFNLTYHFGIRTRRNIEEVYLANRNLCVAKEKPQIKRLGSIQVNPLFLFWIVIRNGMRLVFWTLCHRSFFNLKIAYQLFHRFYLRLVRFICKVYERSIEITSRIPESPTHTCESMLFADNYFTSIDASIV